MQSCFISHVVIIALLYGLDKEQFPFNSVNLIGESVCVPLDKALKGEKTIVNSEKFGGFVLS